MSVMCILRDFRSSGYGFATVMLSLKGSQCSCRKTTVAYQASITVLPWRYSLHCNGQQIRLLEDVVPGRALHLQKLSDGHDVRPWLCTSDKGSAMHALGNWCNRECFPSHECSVHGESSAERHVQGNKELVTRQKLAWSSTVNPDPGLHSE